MLAIRHGIRADCLAGRVSTFDSGRVLIVRWKILYCIWSCSLVTTGVKPVSSLEHARPPPLAHLHSSPRGIAVCKMLRFVLFLKLNWKSHSFSQSRNLTRNRTKKNRNLSLWERIQKAYIIKQNEADTPKIHDRPSIIDCGGQLRGRW
jgi:hypothetical protein